MTNPDYQRGYNKGVASQQSRLEEYRVALDAMTRRAERAEVGSGLGRCDQCKLWRRENGALWGWCRITEKVIGLDWPWRGDPKQAIATKQNFGCIRFDPARAAGLASKEGGTDG